MPVRCQICEHENDDLAERCAECGEALAPAPARDAALAPAPARDDAADTDAAPTGPAGPADAEDPRGADRERRPSALHPQAREAALLREMASHLRAPRLEERTDVRYAGFFRRGVAFGIDLVVLGLFSLPLTLATVLAVEIGARLAGAPRSTIDEEAVGVLLTAGSMLMVGAYFTLLHRGGGQTIGKAMLGIGVRTSELDTVGVFRSLVRTLSYVVSSFLFGFGFVLIALTPTKRGWHDFVAGTCVVRLARDRA